MVTFTTTLLQTGKNTVGIEVPEEVVASFGAGKRIPVSVTINDHTYQSTIAVMGGRYLVGVGATHRTEAGVAGGEEHDVTIEHDPGPRTVEVPADLAQALGDAGLRERFDGLAFSYRKEHVRAVQDAKTEATRERRITRVLEKVAG